MSLRRILAGAVAVILVSIAVLVVSGAMRGTSDAAGRSSSCDDAVGATRAGWNSPGSVENGDPTARQKIADRLVKCKTLLGKPYETVSKLLGEPDFGSKRQRSVSYLLGDERDFIKVDSEYLDLDLDKSYEVISASVG